MNTALESGRGAEDFFERVLVAEVHLAEANLILGAVGQLTDAIETLGTGVDEVIYHSDLVASLHEADDGVHANVPRAACHEDVLLVIVVTGAGRHVLLVGNK